MWVGTCAPEEGEVCQKLTKVDFCYLLLAKKVEKSLQGGRGVGLKYARFWLTSIKYVPLRGRGVNF